MHSHTYSFYTHTVDTGHPVSKHALNCNTDSVSSVLQFTTEKICKILLENMLFKNIVENLFLCSLRIINLSKDYSFIDLEFLNHLCMMYKERKKSRRIMITSKKIIYLLTIFFYKLYYNLTALL